MIASADTGVYTVSSLNYVLDWIGSSQNLLQVPFLKSATGRRSFAFAAPTVWNSLPLTLRSATTLTTFRSDLKTYLFPKLPP